MVSIGVLVAIMVAVSRMAAPIATVVVGFVVVVMVMIILLTISIVGGVGVVTVWLLFVPGIVAAVARIRGVVEASAATNTAIVLTIAFAAVGIMAIAAPVILPPTVKHFGVY